MIELKNEQIEVLIQPKGAELITLKKHGGLNVLWKKDDVFWNRVAPNLFPIVGRLKYDSYSYNGKTFSMKQHGFARDLIFEIIEQTDTKTTFLLVDSNETRKQYPFSFEFVIEYVLVDSEIRIKYKTKNLDQKLLYYSVGGHPGFRITQPLENYQLNFHNSFEANRWLIDSAYYSGEVEHFPIDKTLKLHDDFFRQDAIVFRKPPFNSVTLETIDSTPIVTIQSDSWDAIGFWTKINAPFFCIEPWWGWADSINSSGKLEEKQGLHVLEFGKTEEFSFQIVLH